MTPEEVVALEERLDANPKSRSFLQLAEAYLEHGQSEKALPLLVQGVEYYPYYLAARITLGQVQKSHGLLDDAIKNFEFVTRTIPDNLIAQKNLALLFFQQGEKSKAKEALSLALGLSPNDPELLSLQEKLDHPSENAAESQKIEPDRSASDTSNPPLIDTDTPTRSGEPEPILEAEPLLEDETGQSLSSETSQEFTAPDEEPDLPARTEKTPFVQESEEDENELLHMIPQTETMGDLFMSQKRYSQAEKIYAAILEQSPQNSRISEKLERARTHTPLDGVELENAPDSKTEPAQTGLIEEPETEHTSEINTDPVSVSGDQKENEEEGSIVPSSAKAPEIRSTYADRPTPSDQLLERLKDRLYRDLIGIIFASENGLLLSDQSRDENSEILAAEGIELLRQLDELALSLGQGSPIDGFVWLERSILYFVNRTPEGGLFLWLRPNANIGRCRLIIQQELGITSPGGPIR
ncbi:MAG: tetratricopeptide repeat protein [Leptospirales bacterium]